MKNRVVVWALLVSLLGNTVCSSAYTAGFGDIVSAPFRMVDWTIGKVVNGAIKGVTWPVGKINGCAAILGNKLPKPVRTTVEVAGHLVPIIPIMKTMADRDRFFYVFMESPLIGAITTPVSGAVANTIHGDAPFLGDMSKFYAQTSEIYQSYQGTQLIRNGIATNPHLTSRMKLVLNWYYSALVYALRTAGPEFAKAKTPQEMQYAYSLVAFSALWPLFSQQVGNVTAQLLFSRFLTATQLRKIRDNTIKSEDLVRETFAKVQSAQAKLNELQANSESTKKELKKAKNELAVALSQAKWTFYFRTNVDKEGRFAFDDNGGNASLKRARYWGTKTGYSMIVAVAMTTLYFLLRWGSVGRSAKDDDGVIKKVFGHILSQNDPKVKPTEEELNDATQMIKASVEDLQNHPELLNDKTDITDLQLAG